MQLKTVILDDEPDSINLLCIELAQNCPQVEVVGTYTNPLKALNEIETLHLICCFWI
jgi:two-component system LytT family response regulator